MALVTWTCGHKSRVFATQKHKATYMKCENCREEEVKTEPIAENEDIERQKAEVEKSEIHYY